MNRHEITVVGGGMVGSALALGLLQAGFEVALIETTEPQRNWPAQTPGTRVSALNRSSQNLLSNLGVWPTMKRLGVSPYRQMRVVDATSQAQIGFDCQEIDEPNLGHIVENRVTQLALWQALEAGQRLSLYCPAQVTGLDMSHATTRGNLLVLADGRRLETGLVLAADGANSPIRHFAGIQTLGWFYDHHALVTSVRLANGHGQSAFQVFLPGAILAFLPLAGDICSIVWSCPAQQAAHLKDMDEAAFLAELNKASGKNLGPMSLCGPRAAFPLRLQQAEAWCKPGLALLGDAAHAIHPLAGQGVNLGFLDVAELIKQLKQGRAAGRAPGHLRDLRAYERARKGNALGMAFAMDGFKRLFGSQNPLLTHGRSLGLRLADRLAPLNHHFMRQALGQIGDLPPLAQRFFGS